LFWEGNTWSVHLLRAETLRRFMPEEFPEFLAELEREAVHSNNPAQVSELLTWMPANGLASEATSWLRSLVADLTTRPPVALAAAELFVYQKDWPGLRSWIQSADWGSEEPLRLAYLARATQQLPPELHRPNEVETLWAKAIRAAGRNAAQLEQLANFSTDWKLTQQELASWTAVAEVAASPERALLHLNALYREKGDAAGRFRTARKLLEVRPDDRFAQTETAYLGLLLNEDRPDPHPLAENLRRRPPFQPEVLVTYAFSLWRQNRIRDAVKAFEALPINLREKPAWAWFYGVLLAEAGDYPKARRYLTLGADQHRCAEEEALFRQARQRVGTH
jgi:tetratricopeptide (TPR) repeat protein